MRSSENKTVGVGGGEINSSSEEEKFENESWIRVVR
jgi:hypothetical protein